MGRGVVQTNLTEGVAYRHLGRGLQEFQGVACSPQEFLPLACRYFWQLLNHLNHIICNIIKRKTNKQINK
ncbi:unnamed protein product [Anisakis simplex]|uniref:Uncharacterized protein n=1 Tax=Anisakis simplex TaxID=6269 RepID=A0A0M3J8T2_ANISI|nr:unnamed protein product [Anisakis simplex]